MARATTTRKKTTTRAKKSTTRKTAAKRKPAKRATASKAKKTTTRKTTARKSPAKKSTARKSTARKTTARKTTARKTTARKTTARKTTASKSTTSTIKSTFKVPTTKTELMTTIAEAKNLTKKEVIAVFEGLEEMIKGHIKSGAAGMFTLPGLLKVEVKRKPATKARKGINPFTGEETTFKAKPARNVVKIKPLKKLKEMV
ncbi:MAG: integration host factor [Legionellales bacterium]|nr:integration host factor [Legionellales bacterium]|tara:strand:- start:11452 stop:12054 length:603 start_codon:yes stop_codon:yes gene_type:complete